VPIALAVALALVTACASHPDSTAIATTFDACSPPELVTIGATAVQADGIAAAVVLWQRRGVPDLGSGSGSQLPIVFQDAAPLFHGFYDDTSAKIYINSELSDAHTLAIVIAHELGHAFGLHHVDPKLRSSVMNAGNLVVEPTADDQTALESLWGVCDRGS
jgi:hypothetical protein